MREIFPGQGKSWPVAIVLGANVLLGGEPSPALKRRIDHGIDLYRMGYASNLLVTGGAVTWRVSEAAVMRDLAVAAGVPADRIIIEDRARDTLENALFSAAMLRHRGWTEAVVVTDAYHLPRALYTFRRFGVAVEGSAPPRTGDLASRIARIREVPARLVYVVRVWKALKRHGGDASSP